MSAPERRSGGGGRSAPVTGDADSRSVRTLSRRALIGGLAASGLTAGLVGSLLAACSDGSDPTAAQSAGAEEAIVRIGRRYRTDHPEEDDRDLLAARLGVEEGSARSASFLSSLGAQVTDDYTAGRTILLDGWVLSVTEARAAALVSLA